MSPYYCHTPRYFCPTMVHVAPDPMTVSRCYKTRVIPTAQVLPPTQITHPAEAVSLAWESKGYGRPLPILNHKVDSDSGPPSHRCEEVNESGIRDDPLRSEGKLNSQVDRVRDCHCGCRNCKGCSTRRETIGNGLSSSPGVTRLTLLDVEHNEDRPSGSREVVISKRNVAFALPPDDIPDVPNLSVMEIGLMYSAFLDLIRSKMNMYRLDWVDLDGTPADRWNMLHEFTLKMMKRPWSHVYISDTTFDKILKASIRLARFRLDKGQNWVCLPGDDRSRTREKAYEFLIRMAEESNFSTDIVVMGSSKLCRGVRRPAVLPRSRDGEPHWD